MPLSAWAQLVVEAMYAGGVRRVVLSPGGRSMPFALAAAADPRLDCCDVINESSAAFLALGMARAEPERPVALICTSGSAAAHYFPAVIEASQSRLPLVLFTADRPPELHHGEAPQTVDQHDLYGRQARGFFDPGPPEERPAWLRRSAQTLARAIHTSLHPEPGPVQVNLPARKPLSPSGERAELPKITARAAAARQLAPGEGAYLARALSRARRPLLIAGPRLGSEAEAAALRAQIARLGLPLYAEASSQLRFCFEAESEAARAALSLGDALPTLLSHRRVAPPDLVIQLGLPPTAGAWQRALRGQDSLPRIVVHPHGWPDPDGGAERIIQATAAEALTAITAEAPSLSVDPEWLAQISAERACYWAAVEAALAEAPGLAEGAAVRALWAALPPGGDLMVGNGLPVRHLDRFLPGSLPAHPVYAQRGANGIDGLVAGAVGLQRARARPLSLLVGDVSLAHDLSGLAEAHRAPGLQILALDNGGGRIFDLLPVHKRLGDQPIFEHLSTPPAHRPELVARALGLEAAAVDSEAALREALSAPPRGARLLSCRCPPHGALGLERALKARLEAC